MSGINEIKLWDGTTLKVGENSTIKQKDCKAADQKNIFDFFNTAVNGKKDNVVTGKELEAKLGKYLSDGTISKEEAVEIIDRVRERSAAGVKDLREVPEESKLNAFDSFIRKIGSPVSKPGEASAPQKTPEAPSLTPSHKQELPEPPKAPELPASHTPEKPEAPKTEEKPFVGPLKPETSEKKPVQDNTLEPITDKVTVGKWGSRNNDCLERIITKNYGVKAGSAEYQRILKTVAKENGIKNVDVIRTGSEITLPPIDKKTGAVTQKKDTPAEAPEKTDERERQRTENSRRRGVERQEEEAQQRQETRKAETNRAEEAIKDPSTKKDFQENRDYIPTETLQQLNENKNTNKHDYQTAIQKAQELKETLIKDPKNGLDFNTTFDWTKTDYESQAIEKLRKAAVEEGLKPGTPAFNARREAIIEEMNAEKERRDEIIREAQERD